MSVSELWRASASRPKARSSSTMAVAICTVNVSRTLPTPRVMLVVLKSRPRGAHRDQPSPKALQVERINAPGARGDRDKPRTSTVALVPTMAVTVETKSAIEIGGADREGRRVRPDGGVGPSPLCNQDRVIMLYGLRPFGNGRWRRVAKVWSGVGFLGRPIFLDADGSSAITLCHASTSWS
jgi:hypothetical protein